VGLVTARVPRQPPPRANLDAAGFPSAVLSARDKVWRSHRATLSPWWYSSDGSGRFDLEDSKHGTLYAADDLETAVRERLRGQILSTGFATAHLARSFAVAPRTMAGPQACRAVGLRILPIASSPGAFEQASQGSPA